MEPLTCAVCRRVLDPPAGRCPRCGADLAELLALRRVVADWPAEPFYQGLARLAWPALTPKADHPPG